MLQGALLPPLFSFHPPLAFQVAAFDGGASWMVAVEYGTLAPSQQQQPPQQQAQPPQQQQGRRRGPGAASSGGKPRAGPGGGEAAERTPEAWQQAQLARLAAVRQLYSAAAALPDLAVPAPAQPQQQGPGALQPALLLLTSAAAEASGLNAAAALESVGLPGFQAALGLHLNGLAAAPADASPQHVQCMAAAQRAHAAQHAHRPLLCSAQLEAAFGREWLQELQVPVFGALQRCWVGGDATS